MPDPVWNRNGTLREGYAVVDAVPELHPEGIYYLRYPRDGRRRWQAVGKIADAALVAFRNTDHDLQSIHLGIAAPSTTSAWSAAPDSPSVERLVDVIEVYLAEVRRFRAPKTISACEGILGLFGSRLSRKRVKDISRKDLLDHMSFLKSEGLGDRTIHDHIMRICTLLKSRGVVGVLSAADKPKDDEKEVEAYTSDSVYWPRPSAASCDGQASSS